MKWRPWKANSFSPSQEVNRILWKPEIHHRLHKSLQLILILIQNNPVRAIPVDLSKMRFNIILSTTPKLSKWPFSFKFSHQYPLSIFHFLHTCYIPRPSHSTRINRPCNIWCGMHIVKRRRVQFSPLPCDSVSISSSAPWLSQTLQPTRLSQISAKIAVATSLKFQFPLQPE